MQIIPSILTNNLEKITEDINKLNEVILPHGFPLERLQIDINDGTFLGIKTVEPEVFTNINCKEKLDFHLMVSEPINLIERCANVNADRIIGQIEYMSDQEIFINKISEKRINVGVAVDFGTELIRINPDIMGRIDVILLMAYPAGMGGQNLNESVYDKIEQLKEIKLKGGYNFKICLDGGITLDNIKRVKLAGIDEVAIGNKIIEGDIEDNLEKFYKAMY